MGSKGQTQSTGRTGTERRNRRNRRLAGAGAAVVLALPTLMVVGHSTAVKSAVAAALADPASILDVRSPGGRAPGALTQTKRRYAKSPVRPAAGPTERVLGQSRTRPDVPVVAGAADPLVQAPVDVPRTGFGDAVAGTPDAVVAGTPVFAGAPVVGIGAGTAGGGGVGGGGTGTTPTNPVTPPVSAVPEPSTWLMTILGFMGIGAGLRRRRSMAVAGRVAA